MSEDNSAQEAGVSVRPPKENLFRAQPAIEVARSEDGGMPTLTGHFAVFNQWTEINSMWEGNFMERFAPGAFDKTIQESRDSMKVLFQHGRDPQIGDKPLGTIASLRPDDKGVRYEVGLFDTTYNRDLVPGLEAGAYGASFRFAAVKESYDEKPARSAYNPDGIPERTITEARVAEFGPVTFPAYKGATAGIRSITDEFVIGRMLDDPERLLELIEYLKSRGESMKFAVERLDTDESKEFAEANNSDANRASEPEPSEATTPISDEPEPSEATTPRVKRPRSSAGLFTLTRKEKPQWLL